MPQPPDSSRSISVIVPVINEQEQLATTLARVPLAPGDELIVVDGGSTDETLDIARKFTPNVLSSPPGRARQMNLGAARAAGDILLFLHADTILSPDSLDAVRQAMQLQQVAGGAFRLVIEPTTPALRLIAWGRICARASVNYPMAIKPCLCAEASLKHSVAMPMNRFSKTSCSCVPCGGTGVSCSCRRRYRPRDAAGSTKAWCIPP